MPDGKTRSREQSIWLIMVWIVTLAAMVGLGVLIGKYVLSYYASSLQTPRSSQALTTQQRIASSDSTQKDETPASSIATGAVAGTGSNQAPRAGCRYPDPAGDNRSRIRICPVQSPSGRVL